MGTGEDLWGLRRMAVGREVNGCGEAKVKAHGATVNVSGEQGESPWGEGEWLWGDGERPWGGVKIYGEGYPHPRKVNVHGESGAKVVACGALR